MTCVADDAPRPVHAPHEQQPPAAAAAYKPASKAFIVPPPPPPKFSFTKQFPHPPQHAILLRIVGVLLGRDLQQRRESRRVTIDAMPDALRDLESTL